MRTSQEIGTWNDGVKALWGGGRRTEINESSDENLPEPPVREQHRRWWDVLKSTIRPNPETGRGSSCQRGQRSPEVTEVTEVSEGQRCVYVSMASDSFQVFSFMKPR